MLSLFTMLETGQGVLVSLVILPVNTCMPKLKLFIYFDFVVNVQLF